MSRENEPEWDAVSFERDPGTGIAERDLGVPYGELEPNSLQIVDAGERKDLDRRIHAPIDLGSSLKAKMQSNRNAAKKRKDFRRALWKDELQRTWSRKKDGPAK